MVRRPFHRSVAALALAGVGLLALGGCASDDDPSDVATTGTEATTTTIASAGSVTTAPATSATSTPAGTTPGGATPEEVSQVLYGAYAGDNRESALTVAEPAAVTELFDSGVDATGWVLTQCRGSETVADATECDFGYAGGQATFLVEGNDEDGYRVTTVGFVAE